MELEELINLIKKKRSRYNLSDKYLKENNYTSREDIELVGEYVYGITFVEANLILPHLLELQELKNKKEVFGGYTPSIKGDNYGR